MAAEDHVRLEELPEMPLMGIGIRSPERERITTHNAMQCNIVALYRTV